MLGLAERRKQTVGGFPQRFSSLAHDSPWAFGRRRFKARPRPASTVRPNTAKGKGASFFSHRPGGRIFFEHPPCLRIRPAFARARILGAIRPRRQQSRSVDGLGRSERAKRAPRTGEIRSIPSPPQSFQPMFSFGLRPCLGPVSFLFGRLWAEEPQADESRSLAVRIRVRLSGNATLANRDVLTDPRI